MNNKVLNKFTAAVNHPYLNLVVAVVLFFAGFSEAIDEFREIEEFRVGAHHGIAIYAAVQMLKAIVEIIEGLKYVEEATR